MARITEVDEYINDQEVWKQEIMTRVRELVYMACPDAVETFKWNAPNFEDHGRMVWMVSAREWIHVSFPHGALLPEPKMGWEEGEDTTSKGMRTLKFRSLSEINEVELMNLVRQASANNRQGKKVEFAKTKPGSKKFAMPDELKSFLQQHGQLEAFLARPYYQQKGYAQWIDGAKTDATRQKRYAMMLVELRHGQYMPSKSERIEEEL